MLHFKKQTVPSINYSEGVNIMQILTDILCLILAIGIAIAAGKLISRLKLPAILGWLIAGMIMGPMHWSCLEILCWTHPGSTRQRAC